LQTAADQCVLAERSHDRLLKDIVAASICARLSCLGHRRIAYVRPRAMINGKEKENGGLAT
jgi:hypothetical protein